MKEFITYLVQNIVDKPEAVTVEKNVVEQFGRPTKIYTITADSEDIKKIIGKKGSTIQSIRNICKLRAFKLQEFVDVKING